jgi:hypothetical protein
MDRIRPRAAPLLLTAPTPLSVGIHYIMVVFIIIPQFLKKAIAFFNFSRDKKPPVLFRDGRLGCRVQFA